MRQPGRHSGRRIDDGNPERRGITQLRLDIDIEPLRFALEIDLVAHHDTRRRAVDLQTVGTHDALLHRQLAGHAVKGEALAEHILEIQGDPARQVLQADQPKQFTGGTGVELEELALEERGLIVSNEKQLVYRTVEGNLGMRISACGIVESLGAQQVLACADPVELAACTGVSPEQKMPQEMLDDLAAQLQNYTEKLEAQPQSIVPEGSGLEAAFDTALATAALAVAIRRHAGKIAEKNIEMGIGAGVPVGRDLRKITKVLAVGGIFAHSSPQRSLGILQRAFARPGYSLLPAQCDFVVDRNYLLYSLGVLAQQYPDAALDFGLQAFALEREG